MLFGVCGVILAGSKIFVNQRNRLGFGRGFLPMFQNCIHIPGRIGAQRERLGTGGIDTLPTMVPGQAQKSQNTPVSLLWMDEAGHNGLGQCVWLWPEVFPDLCRRDDGQAYDLSWYYNCRQSNFLDAKQGGFRAGTFHGALRDRNLSCAWTWI